MNQTLYFLQEQYDLMEEAADRNLDILCQMNEYFSKFIVMPQFLALLIMKSKKYKRVDKEFDLIFSRHNNERAALQTLRKMIHEILNPSMIIEINKIKF